MDSKCLRFTALRCTESSNEDQWSKQDNESDPSDFKSHEGLNRELSLGHG